MRITTALMASQLVAAQKHPIIESSTKIRRSKFDAAPPTLTELS